MQEVLDSLRMNSVTAFATSLYWRKTSRSASPHPDEEQLKNVYRVG